MVVRHLSLVNGGLAGLDSSLADPAVQTDPWVFQEECARAFAVTWTVRGFAPSTIRCYARLLARVLGCFDRPVWEVGPAEVDAMVRALVVADRAPGTRRA